MDAVRLIHFADLHLGVEAGGRPNPATGLNQRIHDVLDRLDELCECVEAEGVHAVLFAGDAFKHQHPTPTLQSLFASRIRRLARAGARVFLLVGNHDLPRQSTLSHPFSIYDALEVEGVVVGDRARVYTLDLPPGAPVPALQVAALPHFSRHQVMAKLPADLPDPDQFLQARLAETVKGLAAAVDPSVPAVFCGHCHVNQASIGSGQDLFGLSDVEVSLSTLTAGGVFAYYALGHVHHRQVLSREPFVAYSGSLERVDFGEGEKVRVDGRVEVKAAEDKGFYRLDLTPDGRLAAEPEFRPVAARRFVTVRAGALGSQDPTADVLNRITAARAKVDFSEAFVKVTCTLEAADRSRLSASAVAAALPEAYHVRVAAEIATESHTPRDPRFAARMDEMQALERYVESRDDWAADQETLISTGRELIAEVLG